MAQNAKIALSEQELQLLLNKDWILTKRLLLQKTDALLAMALPGLRALASSLHWLPLEAAAANGKIHRGENYRGLPYLMLDYPAFFSKQGSFALRSMFWWGHFFSVTLHLSGMYKTRFEAVLLHNAALLQSIDLYICTGNDEWEHHFDSDNYALANGFDLRQLQQLISEKKFVKLALKTPLGQWDNVPAFIVQQSGKLLDMLAP